jgi:hypothetical protein
MNAFEDNTKQLNLFVMGVGNVEKNSLNQTNKRNFKDNLKNKPESH